MSTTINLKKVLHRPQTEMCNVLPSASAAGTFVRAAYCPAYAIDFATFVLNTSTIHLYDASADTVVVAPASGAGGTFGAGACGRLVLTSSTAAISAGSTTTFTTSITAARDIRGYRVRVISGPGAGDERIIASNTIGANAVFTTTSAFSTAITAASTIQILAPALYFFVPSATAPAFVRYNYLTNSWTALSATGVATNFGTDGLLTATQSILGAQTDSADSPGRTFSACTTALLTLAAGSTNWITNTWTGGYLYVIAGTGVGQVRTIASNTATSVTFDTALTTALDATSVWVLFKGFESSRGKTFGSATTSVLTLSAGAAWTVNTLANYQIRIVSGTGAGQVRAIASNTASTITVGAVWTTAPDATSIWVVEGNDDSIYLAGNAAIALYKYSISATTWSTLAPTTARAAVTGAGLSLNWITGVSDATGAAPFQNGRYIYSFRGAGGAILDVYDLALNTWTNAVTYGPSGGETFTTGASYEYDGQNKIFIYQPTGRVLFLDLLRMALIPAFTINYPQSTAVVGDKLFMRTYVDGSTVLPILYAWRHTGTEMFRTLLWYLNQF